MQSTTAASLCAGEKQLGAKVEAFDPRMAVKEQVMSLGAQFIAMEGVG